MIRKDSWWCTKIKEKDFFFLPIPFRSTYLPYTYFKKFSPAATWLRLVFMNMLYTYLPKWHKTTRKMVACDVTAV